MNEELQVETPDAGIEVLAESGSVTVELITESVPDLEARSEASLELNEDQDPG